MTARDAWQRLGIDPTEDVRAIRRAYADRLRELDADAGSDAFMGLRDARDVALANRHAAVADDDGDDDDGEWVWAQDADHEDGVLDPDDDDDDDDALDGWHGESRPTPLLQPSRTPAGGGMPVGGSRDTNFYRPLPDLLPRDGRPPTRPSGDAAGADRADADPGSSLRALLERNPGVPLADDDLTAASAWLDAVATDAGSATIERHAEIDDWLAALLSRTVPRSDPLIAPAGKLFGWEARVNDLDLPPALEHLVARQRMFNFVEAVTRPGHPYHRAWCALSRRPQDKSWRGWFATRRLGYRLLTVIRRDFPGIEDAYLDRDRVRLWQGGLAAWAARTRSRAGTVFWIVLILAVVARAIGALATH